MEKSLKEKRKAFNESNILIEISKLNKWKLKSRPFDAVFTYTDEHHTPHTYEYVDDVHIPHTLEYTDERVLDHPVEIPETPKPIPKPILVQLPNN